MKVQEKIYKSISEKGAAYLVLLDPDEISGEKLINFVHHCEKSGVDGFLVGGSLLYAKDKVADINAQVELENKIAQERYIEKN